MPTARERSGKRRVADTEPDAVVRLTLPDGTVETLEIRRRGLTLGERDAVRRAMAALYEPDAEDWIVAYAWAFARRHHPDLKLSDLYDEPFDDVIEVVDKAPEAADSPEA